MTTRRSIPICSFCGRKKPGGVAGSTPALYICRDCIALASEMIDLQKDGEIENLEQS
jgi:hypothetical protein